MSFETTGRLIEVYPVTEVSEKFKKREFVIEQSETKNGFDFKEYVKFQVTQDKCSLPDPFKPGEMVKVSFNLRGRKWEKDGKLSYFTNLEAWKMERISAAKPLETDNSGFPDISTSHTTDKFTESSEEQLDDLPF